MTISIKEVFKTIKNSTGHNPEIIYNFYDNGWLTYASDCKHCNCNVVFATESDMIYINGIFIGKIVKHIDKLEFVIYLKSQKELAICKRFHIMS